MDFFESPLLPPEPKLPERPPQPVWMGASDAELGAPVLLDPVLLACTEKVAVAVTDLLAYPHGVEFELSVRRPRGTAGDPQPQTFMRMRGGGRSQTGEIDPEVLRFGVQFSDGRKATNLDLPFGGIVGRVALSVRQVSASCSDEEGEPMGLILSQRGGGGSWGRYDQRYWLWPLPPPGALAFVCEWPSEQIGETRVEVDSARIREAASRAVTVWKHSDDRETAPDL